MTQLASDSEELTALRAAMDAESDLTAAIDAAISAAGGELQESQAWGELVHDLKVKAEQLLTEFKPNGLMQAARRYERRF